ncbi:MAG: Gfo/Idh/MocA family oxidoreductase [Fimbriimonadaceae bacterium]|nr:Gfo/Idh/MocA family oxidoreductase [Fimbriimonadaceae bacterium]
MERIGIGVVGAGSIGIRAALMHLCLDDVQSRVRLAAVCDAVPGRAQAAAARFGVAAAYDSYEELLADPEVHLVTLGTPIGLHYDQGLAAIAAGKHVHFNKTMSVTTAEATHLINAAAERGVRINASPGQMGQPQNLFIRDFIRSGQLGKVAWALVGAGFGDYHENEGVRQGNDLLSNVNPSWYWKKPGGGPLYDMTVYGLHTLTGILGPAKRVTAMSGIAVPVRAFQGEPFTTEADDNSFLLLDFGDSTFAFVYGAAFGMIESEWGQPNIYGSAGTLLGTRLNGQRLPFAGASDDFNPYASGRFVTGEHLALEEHHVFEDIMELVDWVQTDRAPYGTAEHARHVIEIFEAGYRAAETGTTQTLTTDFQDVEA